MDDRTRSWPRWVLAAALAATLGGCMGTGTSTTGLIEVDPDTPPLDRLEAGEEWESAPAGCEDRLDVEVSFKVASVRDALVAAVDDSGRIVCVDSLESVQTELEEDGRSEEADELVERFLVTVVALPDPGDLWDDPSPQPSSQIDVTDPDVGKDGMNGGDPSPQPS